MINLIRKVSEIEPHDRAALEHVLGTRLLEDQKIIIRVLNDQADKPAEELGALPTEGQLPAWCNVYEGLRDAEIDEIEASIVRSRESRTFE